MNYAQHQSPEQNSPEFLRQPTYPEVARLNTINLALKRLEQVLSSVERDALNQQKIQQEYSKPKVDEPISSPSKVIASMIVESSSKDEMAARSAVSEALQDAA